MKMAYKFLESSLVCIKRDLASLFLAPGSPKGIKRPEGVFPSLPSGMDIILKKHFDTFRDR